MEEKGQTEIFIIVLLAVGIILFFNYGGIRNSIFSPFSKQTKTETSQPVINQKSSYTKPSPSPSQKIEPTPVPTPDTTPPFRSNPQPTGSLPSNTLKTIINFKTDEIAACRYSIYENVSYDAMYDFFQNTNSTFNSTEITTLSPGKEFKFYVKCADRFGNKNLDDFPITFNVNSVTDTTPPQLRYLSPSETLPAGTKTTTLNVTTDEKAYCQYSNYPTGTKSYSQTPLISGGFSSDNFQTYHTANVGGLEDGKVYDFFIKCADTSWNASSDTLIRLQIASQ